MRGSSGSVKSKSLRGEAASAGAAAGTAAGAGAEAAGEGEGEGGSLALSVDYSIAYYSGQFSDNPEYECWIDVERV
jgi:hypothetical protein